MPSQGVSSGHIRKGYDFAATDKIMDETSLVNY